MLPSVTVTLNDLSLALNAMGLTGSVSAAELFHRLQTTHDITIPSIRMAPNLIPDIIVIHANALEAALANLNVTDITATQLLDAIKKEGPTIPDQTNTLLERKFFPFLYANTLFTMVTSEKPSRISRRLSPSIRIYGHHEVC